MALGADAVAIGTAALIALGDNHPRLNEELNKIGSASGYYDDWHLCTSPHLLESLHWLDPAKEFPDKIQMQNGFFVTTSRWANWTNNPFMLNKNFYLEKLTPFAGEGVHFEKNIAPWWVQQNFKIAQGEGLFMHNDLKKYPKKTIFQQYWEKIKRSIKN